MYEQMTERSDILAAWEHLYDDECRHLDVTAFKRLVFDTYWYFRKSKDYNSVPRDDLPIYRYIAWVVMAVDAFPQTCKEYEFLCCNEFAAGLLQAIEDGFQRRYHKVVLCLGLTYHVPAGGDAGEANMSSYDTYDRAFRRELICYMREQIEQEEDSCDDNVLSEQEELRTIASTKGA